MNSVSLERNETIEKKEGGVALKFSILLTTYNRADVVVKTINIIRKQSFQNYEILVWDDCSTDDTGKKVKAIGDPRIVYHRNEKNLSYGRNLQACREHATGDIIYLMGDDDILLDGALQKTYEAFMRGDHIGVVTRPFYIFWDKPDVPIRTVYPHDPLHDVELSVFDGRSAIESLFRSSWQLSGLAFRRKYMDLPFHQDIFPAHVYPYASILKKYKAVFLKDFPVAVLTHLSQSTHHPEIYDTSPIESWIRMFETIYAGPEFVQVKKDAIDFTVRATLPGLFQIKTATSNALVIREIRIILKQNPKLIYNPSFLFCSAIALFIPGRTLRRLLNWYKSNVLGKVTKSGAGKTFSRFWGFGSRF